MNTAERKQLEKLIKDLENPNKVKATVASDLVGNDVAGRMYRHGAITQALETAKVIRAILATPSNACTTCDGECGEWIDGCTCGAFVLCKACGGDGEQKEANQ